MKLILPFTYMDNFHYWRYFDQFKAYADRFDSVELIVEYGVKPYSNPLKNLEITLIRDVEKKDKRKKIGEFVLTRFPLRQEYNLRFLKKHGLDGDVILSYSGAGYAQIYHIMLADRLGIPAVYRMRGNGVYERNFYGSRFNALIQNSLHFRSLQKYAGFIPISEEYKQILINWRVPEKKIIDVVGLGVDTDKFKRTAYPKRLTFGYFGRISLEKNLGFLIEVMKALPDKRFIVVGKNVKKHVFPDNCEYLGYCSKDQMPSMYNKINVLLNPSRTEGLPNVVLEAYSTNTPVAATPCNFKEIACFGWNLDETLQSWVTCLDKITVKRAKQKGKHGREYVQRFGWESYSLKMFNALQKVVEEFD